MGSLQCEFLSKIIIGGNYRDVFKKERKRMGVVKERHIMKLLVHLKL